MNQSNTEMEAHKLNYMISRFDELHRKVYEMWKKTDEGLE